MSGALEKKANDEIAIGRDALRWWDPLLVLVFALVGWFTVVGGPALLLGGSLRDFDPRLATPSVYATNAQGCYALHFYAATFYFAVLFVMCVLARRRGFRLFADYFASIPFWSMLSAALLGAGIGERFASSFSAPERSLPFQSYTTDSDGSSYLGRLALSSHPLLRSFTSAASYWITLSSTGRSVRINALVFALLHFRFLLHPGISGWIETIWIGIIGLWLASYALRDDSLRAPVAAHAAVNALFLLCMYFLE